MVLQCLNPPSQCMRMTITSVATHLYLMLSAYLYSMKLAITLQHCTSKSNRVGTLARLTTG